MFWDIRYQTGELNDVVRDMKEGKTPCMDVDNTRELNWVLEELEKLSMFRVEELPYDKDARDRIKEPEFEFRIGFCPYRAKAGEANPSDIMYIDFYFEPDVEKTYDPIFGD